MDFDQDRAFAGEFRRRASQESRYSLAIKTLLPDQLGVCKAGGIDGSFAGGPALKFAGVSVE